MARSCDPGGAVRPLDGLEGYKADLRRLTAASNEMVLGVVEELATYHAGGARPSLDARQIAARAQAYAADLLAMRDAFMRHHQDTLVDALRAGGTLAA